MRQCSDVRKPGSVFNVGRNGPFNGSKRRCDGHVAAALAHPGPRSERGPSGYLANRIDSAAGFAMTLVVARNSHGRIAIVSDTMLTEHDRALPHQQGVIKSCMLPGGLCVSFANSPELAARDFRKFVAMYPQGARFTDSIAFFERSSAKTENDYILAFSRSPRLVKIVEGRRTQSAAATQWIGDASAYNRFREYESRYRKRQKTDEP